MSDAPELQRAVKAYLDAISQISRVGTPELSHYTALDNLFDAIGDQLKPKVRAVVHHSEAGGDQPDLGLFFRRLQGAAVRKSRPRRGRGQGFRG